MAQWVAWVSGHWRKNTPICPSLCFQVGINTDTGERDDLAKGQEIDTEYSHGCSAPSTKSLQVVNFHEIT